VKDWRPKLAAIDDLIADDYWSYETRDGTRRTSRVTIGRPAPLADERDWYCPIRFQAPQGVEAQRGSALEDPEASDCPGTS
jgi:hypothetical protein